MKAARHDTSPPIRAPSPPPASSLWVSHMCVCVCMRVRTRALACGVCPWASGGPGRAWTSFFRSQPETLNSEIKQDSRGSQPGGLGLRQQAQAQGGAASPASSYGQGAAEFYSASASGEWAADGRTGRGRQRTPGGGDWRGALRRWGLGARCLLLAVESLQTCYTRTHTRCACAVTFMGRSIPTHGSISRSHICRGEIESASSAAHGESIGCGV